MKEAAGEANLTVVAIILIGVVVAIATPLIGSLMSNTAKRACCTDAGGVWKGSACDFNNSTSVAGGEESYQACLNSANANRN